MEKDKLTEKQKMEIAYEAVNSNKTQVEIAEKHGVSAGSIAVWRKKYLPDMLTLDDLTEMTEKEIDKKYERNASITKVIALQRILTLIPGEEDIAKLSSLLKELKSINQAIEPKERSSPWSIQVHQAIQQITNHNIIQDGKSTDPNRD